ncbi:MAG: hypothetical protein COA78_12015 [Blastopirellula sp.]|nr:MAG: hypothetical protein COA78_12015 [Blastopirellula sp.]
MTNKVLSKQEASAIAAYKYGDSALKAYRDAFPQSKKWKTATVKAKAKRLFDSVDVVQGKKPSEKKAKTTTKAAKTRTTVNTSKLTPAKKPTSKRKTPKKIKSPDKQTKLPVYELSDEQKELYNACTNLQRRVVIFITQGNISQRKAYYAAGGTAKSDETADVCVSVLLSNAKVKAFYDSLTVTEIRNSIMSRTEMLETLTTQARWDLPTLLKMNKEQTEAFRKLEPSQDEIKHRISATQTAMRQLAKANGYDSATQFEISSPTGKAIRHITNDMSPEEAARIYKESLKKIKD